MVRKRAVRKRRIKPKHVDPQTQEPILTQREISAIASGDKAKLLGDIGELLIRSMYPHWMRSKPTQEGLIL